MTRTQVTRLKRKVLEHFAVYGNITQAAIHAGIERKTIYNWQEHDDEFAVAFREAELKATEHLEAEARRRAVEGVDKQRRVYDNRGNLIDEYTETSYSDTLLIFLLKARAPEKYRDRHDITTGGQPLQQSTDELDAAIERRLALMAIGSQGADALAADRA